jgi:hypothetical protein
VSDEPSDSTILGVAGDFVAFRGDADLHDGTVLSVQHDGDQAGVIVRGGSGSKFELGFSGVVSITQHHAEGMMLYALAEMSADPPLRRFVFTNWDDEDDARLELVARDIDCRPLPF